MALSDVPLLTKDFDVNGVTVTLRGLSLSDLGAILPRYGSQIAVLFGKAYSNTPVNPSAIAGFAQTLATEAPELAAEIIALAADDASPAGIAIARRLPFGTQIAMLEGVYQNTFASEADVKKLTEVISRVVLSLAVKMEQMTPDLLSGAGILKPGGK
jgi:hypothetical protein